MKKIIGIIAIFLLIIASMLIQSAFINKVLIFGVTPNILLVIVVTISLWYGLYIGTSFGVIFGILADSFFGTSIGKYLVLFTCIAILVGYYNKNYKKENIITLIYLVSNMTIIYEVLLGVYSAFITKDMFNIFLLLKIVIISTILNVILASVMYYVTAYICNKIEDLIAEDRW